MSDTAPEPLPGPVPPRAPTVEQWTPEHGAGHIALEAVRVDTNRVLWIKRDAPVFDEQAATFIAPEALIEIRRTAAGDYAVHGPVIEAHLRQALAPGPRPDAREYLRAHVV